MKYSAASVLLIAAAGTVQAIPTAIPSVAGRARGIPYDAVRGIQSQRRIARQETTAAGNIAVPDVTRVLDIPTGDLLPTTARGITAEPTAITSVPDVPTTTADIKPTSTSLQTFRVRVRQESVTALPTQAADPIETIPVVDILTASPETTAASPETPIETIFARSP